MKETAQVFEVGKQYFESDDITPEMYTPENEQIKKTDHQAPGTDLNDKEKTRLRPFVYQSEHGNTENMQGNCYRHMI